MMYYYYLKSLISPSAPVLEALLAVAAWDVLGDGRHRVQQLFDAASDLSWEIKKKF